MMLAGMTKTPELALAQPECAELAKALDTVNGFYNVEVAEKTVAWLNLAMVAGVIYGTRVVAIRERRKGDKAKPVNEPASTATREEPQMQADPYATAFSSTLN